MFQENCVYIYLVFHLISTFLNTGTNHQTSITSENLEFQYSAKGTTQRVIENTKMKQIK